MWFPSQLAQDGLVNQSDAQLLHELGERAITLLHSYFRSPSGLFVAYTHLVCRSAIAGKITVITQLLPVMNETFDFQR